MTKKEMIICRLEFQLRLLRAYGFKPSKTSVRLLEAGVKGKGWGCIYASINGQHFYDTDVNYVRKVNSNGFPIEGQEPILI